MDIERIKQAFKDIEKGINSLKSGPLTYYMQKLTGAYDLLLSPRFAPFQVGDTVILTKDAKIDRPDHGWQCSKHFLIKGAVGKMISVDVDEDGYSGYVQFENDSWIDPKSQKETLRAPKDRGNYTFHEDYLVRAQQAAKETP